MEILKKKHLLLMHNTYNGQKNMSWNFVFARKVGYVWSGFGQHNI